MDASFILVIGISAILTAGLMIFSEITSRRSSTFRLAFCASYLLGLALMQPWHIESTQEAGMSAAMLVFMAIWVAIGCILGAIPTAVVIGLARWFLSLAKKKA
jgi:hypothetical protein